MKAVPGNLVYDALKDEQAIILACNPRITIGVAEGVFKAAKDLDSPVIMELARSECNQNIGYTGLTPQTLSANLNKADEKIGHDLWILHADHIQVRKGTPDEIVEIKKLIDAQINAGYSSFAIDASHLFNFQGKTVEEELAPNLNVTIEIAKYIKTRLPSFGLEVEVGEIGRKDSCGMVLTKPEEAVAYIKSLVKAGINPNLIAIANGSTHGNCYDKDGNMIAQTTIDIEQTKKVAQALRDNDCHVRIAQHGITGTPLDIIKNKFPHGDILKGNVATLFQNIVYDTIQKYHTSLWNEIYEWVLKNHPIEGKKPNEVFGKNVKYATKEFFARIYDMSDECRQEIEEKAYEAASDHIKAFNAEGTASIVRKKLNR
ncbi:MAG TPA: class II fructose-bisphosphate aldolase [Candidatus Nanoarchaeia archaeon]|nr:class II fructose-bisphosphate aldolase [Candidatus Nanoarchaeia archaeon]